jgi:hypothetical protein
MSGPLARDLRSALDPGELLRPLGITPDEWQATLLRERPQRGLMLCSRQVGKSLTAATAALHEALYTPGSLTLMVAPTLRQSTELLRKSRFILAARLDTTTIVSESTAGVELANGSRIISLPAAEDTIRGYSAVALVILDEAARILDELYWTIRPMLAISNGRLLALSTPNGQRGWFHHAWVSDDPWTRVKIVAADCPRISPQFLAEERRTMTQLTYASEYECEFGDTIDSVFAHDDLAAALDETLTPIYPGGW